MLSFYLRLFITTLTVVLSSHYVPGLKVNDLNDLVFFGLILGVINAFIRPVITLLTLPLNILTLGLFSLVINAFTYWLASEIAFGVIISEWKGAVYGGAIVWVVSFFSNLFIKDDLSI